MDELDQLSRIKIDKPKRIPGQVGVEENEQSDVLAKHGF